MRRLSLPLEALQEALDASPAALQKGVQQFLTPPDLAAALLSPFYTRGTEHIDAADLFGCGHGILLPQVSSTFPYLTRYGIDLDPFCKPEIDHLLHADITQAAPLLIEAGCRFDLLTANPPFSLTWTVDGKPVNSTLATFDWMTQLLRPLGQGLLLCNAASLPALRAHPNASQIHHTILLPNYFPNTGRWQEMTLAAIYFSPKPDQTCDRHIDLSKLPANDTTLTTLRGSFTPARFFSVWGQPDASPARWNAVSQELSRRKRQRRAGHDLYHICLRPDGTLSTYLTPFEKFAIAPKIDRLLVEDLARLNGRHLRNLVVSRSERTALETAVHSGIWKVDPALKPALTTAIAEYDALRAPMLPMNAIQRLGYLDEYSHILCTKAYEGCQPGRHYRLTTEIVQGRRTERRPRWDKKPLLPCDPPLTEEVLVKGNELEITVHNGTKKLRFMFHPEFSQREGKPRPLQAFLAHFHVPEVQDIATTRADEFAALQARLLTLCPATPPPTTPSPAKPRLVARTITT